MTYRTVDEAEVGARHQCGRKVGSVSGIPILGRKAHQEEDLVVAYVNGAFMS